MADMKFTLPGPDTVTVSSQTVDKLIRSCDGDAALLYLYILRTRARGTSADAAKALRKSAGSIASSMAVLSRLGLIECDDNDAAPPPADPETEQSRRYSLDEIKHEMETSPAFPALVEETQRSLGKILSSEELERLLGIYDGLRLPPEVILLLISHCISESRGRGSGRMPSMRYIEKAAYTWEREEIFSLEAAEAYLKALDTRKSARGEIKAALQIRDRELSSTEKRYVDSWISMGFVADSVGIAYDRTLIQTGKLVWNYMDSIMNSWHSKGLHTPREILEKDTKKASPDTRRDKDFPAAKFGAPKPDDIERMKRLLSKIKED